MSQLTSAITPDTLQSLGLASGNLNAAADRELAYAQLQAEQERAKADLAARFKLQEGQIAAEAEQQKAQAELAKELQSGENQRYREYQDFQSRERTGAEQFQAGQAQKAMDFEAQQREKDRATEEDRFQRARQADLEDQQAHNEALQISAESQAGIAEKLLAVQKRKLSETAKLAAAQMTYGKSDEELAKLSFDVDNTLLPMVDTTKKAEELGQEAAELGMQDALRAFSEGKVSSQISSRYKAGGQAGMETSPFAYRDAIAALTKRVADTVSATNPGAAGDALNKLVQSLRMRAGPGADPRLDQMVRQDYDAVIAAGVPHATVDAFVKRVAELSKKNSRDTERLSQEKTAASDSTAAETKSQAAVFSELSSIDKAFRASGLGNLGSTAAELAEGARLVQAYIKMRLGRDAVAGALKAHEPTGPAADKLLLGLYDKEVAGVGSVSGAMSKREKSLAEIESLNKSIAEIENEMVTLQATANSGPEALSALKKDKKRLEDRLKEVKGRRK